MQPEELSALLVEASPLLAGVTLQLDELAELPTEEDLRPEEPLALLEEEDLLPEDTTLLLQGSRCWWRRSLLQGRRRPERRQRRPAQCWACVRWGPAPEGAWRGRRRRARCNRCRAAGADAGGRGGAAF